MKTTKALIDSKQYLDGSPVYKGDINRMYSSQFVVRITARIVAAPEGAKQLLTSDPDVDQAMKKIPFGQIGAVWDEITLPANTVVSEFVVPVKFNEIRKVKDEILKSHTIQEKLNELKFTTANGKTLSFSEFKEIMSPVRESNRSIRQSWQRKGDSLRRNGATQEEILEEKRAHYKEYTAPAGFSMVIEFTITHVVNNPSLKATVIENLSQDEYNRLAYNEQKVRKVATYKASLITIPLQTVDQYLDITNWYKSYMTGGSNLVSTNYHAVFHEGDTLNGELIDFKALRAHDSQLNRR